jgi:TatD DNase family protein
MNSPADVQQEMFVRQMKMAVKHNKPLVIHTREAEDDTIRLMTETLPQEWKVHVHCFTSSLDLAKKLVEHFPNLCIGFTGAPRIALLTGDIQQRTC